MDTVNNEPGDSPSSHTSRSSWTGMHDENDYSSESEDENVYVGAPTSIANGAAASPPDVLSAPASAAWERLMQATTTSAAPVAAWYEGERYACEPRGRMPDGGLPVTPPSLSERGGIRPDALTPPRSQSGNEAETVESEKQPSASK